MSEVPRCLCRRPDQRWIWRCLGDGAVVFIGSDTAVALIRSLVPLPGIGKPAVRRRATGPTSWKGLDSHVQRFIAVCQFVDRHPATLAGDRTGAAVLLRPGRHKF